MLGHHADHTAPARQHDLGAADRVYIYRGLSESICSERYSWWNVIRDTRYRTIGAL